MFLRAKEGGVFVEAGRRLLKVTLAEGFTLIGHNPKAGLKRLRASQGIAFAPVYRFVVVHEPTPRKIGNLQALIVRQGPKVGVVRLHARSPTYVNGREIPWQAPGKVLRDPAGAPLVELKPRDVLSFASPSHFQSELCVPKAPGSGRHAATPGGAASASKTAAPTGSARLPKTANAAPTPKEVARRARTAHFRRVVDRLPPALTALITQVDPDAIAGTFALQAILAALGRNLRIAYCGEIAHPQNRAIVYKFNLGDQMMRVADLEAGSFVDVLVDSSSLKDERIPSNLVVAPRIVIDHHLGGDVPESERRFVWIERVGAACTLVAELLRDLRLEFDQRTTSFISVLLALGIHTDTKGLINASERDLKAFGYAARRFSAADFRQLVHYELPARHYDNVVRAVARCEQQGPCLLTNLGVMRADEADELSTIADYFLRREGVSLVIVWGIDDRGVRVSARSTNLSQPLDAFLKARFGDGCGAKLTPDGCSEGGARLDLEGLREFRDVDAEPELIALVDKRMKKLIFAPPQGSP